MIQYHDNWLRWREPSCEKGDRLVSHLETILRSWEHTPYMAGQKMKKVGVDCVRFVMAVYEELYGMKPIDLPLLPADTSMHDRKSAIRTMHLIKRLLPPMIVVRDGTIEPGDMIVTGQSSGGPGHAIIVGHQENTLWQAGSSLVHRGGLGLIGQDQHIYRIYRMRDRDRMIS